MKNKRFTGLMHRIVDVVLPPRCPMSGDLVDAQGMLSPESWKKLSFIADPLCQTCGIPFEFGIEDGVNCLSCLENKPIYEKARGALRYDDASRSLILGFKHGDKTYAAVSFVPFLRQAGADILSGADLLVPVPLHPYRLLRRRYNQSAIIAQALSQDTGILHLPLVLRRVRPTPSQGHLSAPDRIKNVKKAFAVTPKYRPAVQGKRIVLIDDVFTTGATVAECTKVLLDAGASSVAVLTLARVVHA